LSLEAIMLPPNLADIDRRPVQYWNVDGIPELVMGALWMLWGCAWLIGEAVPRDWRAQVFWSAVPAALAFTAVGAVWLIKHLKARVTFPRTGYVEWNEPSRASRIATAVVAMVVAAALVAIASGSSAALEQRAPMILGVILALAFAVASLRQRAPHYLALGGVAVALGLAFTAGRGGWPSVNWMFVALGAATAAAGAVRLVLFVRAHPQPSAEGA
jgi:hypothetical protein